MRARLIKWIIEQYAGKLVRISGEPYLRHLMAVAFMLIDVLPFGFEIGLCHDVLEDTGIPGEDLRKELEGLGYLPFDARYITHIVIELTDVYTKVDFPCLSKKERKVKEDERLIGVSGDAQTIKYADLIDNIKWTRRFEQGKAADYLARKKELLLKLDKGDQHLRTLAFAAINA